MSKVGGPMLSNANTWLCQIICAGLTISDFDGVSIFTVGDLYQLYPIKSCPIFKHSTKTCHPGDMAPLLWHHCNCISSRGFSAKE